MNICRRSVFRASGGEVSPRHRLRTLPANRLSRPAAIYEICVVTEPLKKLIMQKRDGGEMKQCAISQGMETLRQDGWRRVAQGKTTIEEVVRVTQTDEVMAETDVEAGHAATVTEMPMVLG